MRPSVMPPSDLNIFTHAFSPASVRAGIDDSDNILASLEHSAYTQSPTVPSKD
jgi:hypothetical protein